MPKAVDLKVNDKLIKSTQLEYNDLIILYEDFINKYGYVPRDSELKSKFNLPQIRIVNKILTKSGITYNEFLNKFGKTSHVRTESDNYDLFLQKFKNCCFEKNRPLKFEELKNNNLGLPSASWFVKYCPDKNVTSYNDFVCWCGFKSNELKLDYDYVVDRLYKFEEENKRPILRSDITTPNIGFSMIVINRIWGSLGNCKKELGLLETDHRNSFMSFDYYKNKVDIFIRDYSKKYKVVTWFDIENFEFEDGKHLNHKTLTSAFLRNNMNIYTYLSNSGLIIFDDSWSKHFLFDDGEKSLSKMEYLFSIF